MKFKQAVEKKKEFGDIYVDEKDKSMELGVLITPKSDKDLEKYFHDRYTNALSFYPTTIIDTDAKKYSTDGQYSIYAIKVLGTILLKKQLA